MKIVSKQSGFFDWPILVMIVLCALAIALVAIAISEQSSQERKRLISQCMQDGRKEYECKAMFRPNSAHVPIVIPVVGGR